MSKINTPFVMPKKAVNTNFDMSSVIHNTPDSFLKKIRPNDFNILVSDAVFLLDEKGQFVKNNLSIMRTDCNNLASGRYFIQDEEGFLRQLQFEQTDNGGELSASRPVTIVELPAAPSFWTKVLAFFGHQASKDKIQTYDEAKEFADACRALAENAEYGVNLNPTGADHPEETMEPDEPQTIPYVPREKELTIKMPHAQFINHLHTVKHYTRDDFEAVLKNENATYKEIVDAQIKLSTAELAHRLIALENVDKDQMQHAFWYLSEAIQNRVENFHGNQIADYAHILNSGDKNQIRDARNQLSINLSNVWGRVQDNVLGIRGRERIVEDITEQLREVKFRYSDSKPMTELKNAAKYTAQDAKDFLGMGERFPQDYKHAIGHLLEAKAAKMLLSKEDLKLDPYKSALEDIHKKVTDFVEKTYGDRIEKNFNVELLGYEEVSEMQMEELIDEVNKDGLDKLLKFMNPEAKQQAKNEPEMKHEIEASVAQSSGSPMVK